MRSVDPDQLGRMEDVLRRAVDRAVDEHNRSRDRGRPLEVDVALIGDRLSGTVDPGTPLIQRALAVTRFLGRQPQLGAASTDANLPIAAGIPAVTIGHGGTGGGAHSLGEWWVDTDAHVGTERALLLLVASAGLVDWRGSGYRMWRRPSGLRGKAEAVPYGRPRRRSGPVESTEVDADRWSAPAGAMMRARPTVVADSCRRAATGRRTGRPERSPRL